MNNSDRATLRMELRRKRQALTFSEQNQAAKALFRRVVSQSQFIKARRIGFYFASDGEIDPLALLFQALEMGKQCLLPVLSAHKPGKVCFAPFKEGDTLVPNQWGILEPGTRVQHLISPRSINLVLVPLVGFDKDCNRMGMGKGFYDRTFSYRSRSGYHKPKLIGLAHECQKVDHVPTEPWDVRLDGVITDQGCYFP